MDSKSVALLFAFFTLLLLYIAVVKIKIYNFTKRKGRNVVYHMFWLYNKKLIGNFPSKSEQRLFKSLNLITTISNSLLFLLFIAYIVLTALGK